MVGRLAAVLAALGLAACQGAPPAAADPHPPKEISVQPLPAAPFFGGASIALAARLAWDDPSGLRATWAAPALPSGLTFGRPPPPPQRREVLVASTPTGVALVNDDREVIALDASGAIAARFELAAPKAAAPTIIDIVSDGDGGFVTVEQVAAAGLQLTRRTAAGAAVWTITTPDRTAPARLIATGKTLTLVARGPTTALIRVDLQSGAQTPVSLDAQLAGLPILTRDGRLLALGRQKEGDERLLLISPDDGRIEPGPQPPARHLALSGLLGLWPDGSLVGQAGATIARFDANGRCLEETRIFNLVPGAADDEVYANVQSALRGQPSAGLLAAKAGGPFGAPFVPDFSEALLAQHDLRNAYLIGVTASKHLVFQRFTNDHQTVRVTYDPVADAVVQAEVQPPDLEQRANRAQPASTWAMNRAGALFIPVLGPDAFRLYRLAPARAR